MTGQEVPQIGRTKTVLNANLGVTNIIEHDAILRDMGKVTDSIFDKLKCHYGPYSSFAGIDPNKPLEDTIFTKDGANIIRAMEFASPLEDWVRRAVYYIGENMEKSAGDGTTSSMMFACGMLKHMTKRLDLIRPVSYNKLCSIYKKFVKLVEDRMKPYILTAKNADGTYDRKKVHDLVYIQAYTSSHGNEDIAEAFAKLFSCSPQDQWEKMIFKRRRYEYDKPFTIDETTHQYELPAEIMSKTVYNKDLNSYLEYEKATFVVVNDNLSVDDIHWKTVKEVIENSSKEHPAAILVHNEFDRNTMGILMDYNAKKDENNMLKYCFAVFSQNAPHEKVNDFANIVAITGNNILDYCGAEVAAKPLVLRDVYIHYKDKKLSLDGLYTDTREKTEEVKFRPMYTDAAMPWFREYADTIKKYITDLEDMGINLSRDQQRELHTVKEMYNKLVYDKTINLVIGGHTFDNLALFDVVDDVVRASRRALKNGVVVSNNKALYAAVQSVVGSTVGDSHESKVIRWLGENILLTLNSFADVVLDQLYPHGKKSLADFNSKYIPWFHRIINPFKHDPFGMDPSNSTEFENYDTELERICEQAHALFTCEERKSFCRWWFDHSVNMLNYENSRTWESQFSDVATSMKDYLRHQYDPRSMIVQPANADIDMLTRFGEIALKFILTERVIVSDSAYVDSSEKKVKKS